MSDYSEWLARKAIIDPPTGIEPGELPAALFPFQADIVRWALRRGRGRSMSTGLFASRPPTAQGIAARNHQRKRR